MYFSTFCFMPVGSVDRLSATICSSICRRNAPPLHYPQVVTKSHLFFSGIPQKLPRERIDFNAIAPPLVVAPVGWFTAGLLFYLRFFLADGFFGIPAACCRIFQANQLAIVCPAQFEMNGSAVMEGCSARQVGL